MNFRNMLFAIAGLLFLSSAGFGQTLEIDDAVWAQMWPNDWYPGTLTEETDLGFVVVFDDLTGVENVDGDFPASADIPRSLIVLNRVPSTDQVEIGTRVLALWPDDEWYYPATIVSDAQEGLYDIQFDDRDVGTVDLTQLLLRGASALSNDTLNVGDTVWAQWEPNDWYPATILEPSEIGFHVEFVDVDGTLFGDPEDAAWGDRPRSLMVLDRAPAADDVAFGTRVLAQWTDDWFYPATVVEISEDGLYSVRYDDGAVGSVELLGLRLLSE